MNNDKHNDATEEIGHLYVSQGARAVSATVAKGFKIEQAEDIVHQAFLDLIRSYDSHQGTPPEHLFRKLLFRRQMDAFRRRYGHAETSLSQLSETYSEGASEWDIPSMNPGPGENTLLKEAERLARVALAGLPNRQREAFEQHYVERMSYEQMAQMQSFRGLTLLALRALVSRAKAAFDDQLKAKTRGELVLSELSDQVRKGRRDRPPSETTNTRSFYAKKKHKK